MSNEKRNPRLDSSAPRLNASSIVRPRTNCPPMMRIAVSIACRITGSPERCTSRPKIVDQSRSPPSSFTTWPVSISANVDAFTNSDDDCPRCLFQFAEPILSLISLSCVSASGTRNSASARHIKTTPSSVDSAYSCRNASSPPRLRCARTRPTNSRASRSVASASATLNRARGSSAFTTSVSSAK